MAVDRQETTDAQQCRAQIECRVDREIDFEERTWFIGRVVAARRDPQFSGTQALLCDRNSYSLMGEKMAPR